MNIYADLEQYYKNNKEQFETIKAKNAEAIKNFSKTEEENDNYKIEFDKPIKFKKQEVSVKKLNQVLEFLFYIKEKGNFALKNEFMKKYFITTIKPSAIQ